METINDTPVFVINDGSSLHRLVALALNSDGFSIEHEQEAQYGQLKILTLDDGLYAYVREIDEHQIAAEDLGERFGVAFIKTVDENLGDGADVVRF